jgi:hypothetical protein
MSLLPIFPSNFTINNICIYQRIQFTRLSLSYPPNLSSVSCLAGCISLNSHAQRDKDGTAEEEEEKAFGF